MTGDSINFGEADLTSCDRELIHSPGSIQPHGVLLVFDRKGLNIRGYAGDTDFLMGLDPAKPLSLSLNNLFNDQVLLPILERLNEASPKISPFILLGLSTRTGMFPLDATIHAHQDVGIIELEAARRTPSVAGSTLAQVKLMTSLLQSTNNVGELCDAAARQMRQTTGFDRVMVYEFLPDGCGKVVAEDKVDGLESYLGMHYPASDIPKQARELFRRNTLRLIPNVNYTPFPLEPQHSGPDGAVDMSDCVLRSVSPIHLEYLRNMGVTASMALSILRDDQLWGIIILHNYTPRYVAADLRIVCEMFAQIFALNLDAKIEMDEARRQIHSTSLCQAVIRQAQHAADIAQALINNANLLFELIPATGFAVLLDGQLHTCGNTPPADFIGDLLVWLNSRSAKMFATEHLSKDFPPAAPFAAMASGVLADAISDASGGWVVWFRGELVQPMTWAGNPEKNEDDEGRLTPRQSFAAWQDDVRGKSLAWDNGDRKALFHIRIGLFETVVNRSNQALTERVADLSKQNVLLEKIQEISRFNEEIITASPIGILVYRQDGQCILANKSAGELVGASQDFLLQQNFRELQSWRDSGLLDMCLKVLDTQSHQSQEIWIRPSWRQETLCIQFRATVLTLGGMHHLLLLASDVSGQKKLVQAQALAQAKGDFLADMSHEIRSPMNAIIGFTRSLKRDIQDSKQADKLEKINRSANHLLGLINDVLDMSKVEAGKLTINPDSFSLRSVLDDVMAMAEIQKQDKPLDLRIDCDSRIPDQLIGDQMRLRQCVINYVNNAVKFTAQGTVTMRTRLDRDGPDGLLIRFEVEDTGIGIADDALARLFIAFEQGDKSTAQTFGGTGLGLALTKRLSLLMGGDAGAQSTLGKGSLFWFTALLPPDHSLEWPQSAGGRADEADAVGALAKTYGAARILIVDDIGLNREVLQDMLDEAGLRADMAENGEVAVTKAKAAPYDIILMDMQMPVMGGLEATTVIRTLAGHERTPVIALTANAFDEDRHRCLAAGMSDFLSKPVSATHLFSVLLKWLGLGGAVKKQCDLIGVCPAHFDAETAEPAQCAVQNASVPLDASLDDAQRVKLCLGCIQDIDMKRLSWVEAKPARYIKYLRQYEATYGDVIQHIRALLADDQWAEARRLAHSLRGSSGMLGVVGIEKQAADLEDHIKAAAALDIVSVKISAVEKQLDVVFAAIKQLGE